MTHVLWVISHVEFDGDTHFHIWPKVRSSLGQKRSNFKKSKFPFKTYLSCPVLSQDSKNVICFVVRQIEIPKIKCKKVTSLPLLGYCAIAQPIIKILVWNFVYMLVAHSSILYIPGFWIFIKKLIFWAFIFKKIKILIFGGQKPKI